MYRFIASVRLLRNQTYRQFTILFLWAMMIVAVWFFGFHIEYKIADSKIVDAILLGRDTTVLEVRDFFLFYFTFLTVISIFVISRLHSFFLLGEITPIILSSGTSRTFLLLSTVLATFIVLLFPYILVELVIWVTVSIQVGEFLWNPFIPILYLSAIFLYINIIVLALLSLTGSRASTNLFSIILCIFVPVVFEVKNKLLYPLFDEHFFPAFIDALDLVILPIPTLIGQAHDDMFNYPISYSFLKELIPITITLCILSVYILNKKKY